MVDGVLKLLFLQLKLLFGGCDVHERAPNLGDVVEHLLVGVVEHLVGVLGRVERFVCLGCHDVVCPLEETHVGALPRKEVTEPGLRCRGYTCVGRSARRPSTLGRVDVRSLGYRTDLMVRLLDGSQVEDRGDYLAVRSPQNPTFWWGNFLLMSATPLRGVPPHGIDLSGPKNHDARRHASQSDVPSP